MGDISSIISGVLSSININTSTQGTSFKDAIEYYTGETQEKVQIELKKENINVSDKFVDDLVDIGREDSTLAEDFRKFTEQKGNKTDTFFKLMSNEKIQKLLLDYPNDRKSIIDKFIKPKFQEEAARYGILLPDAMFEDPELVKLLGNSRVISKINDLKSFLDDDFVRQFLKKYPSVIQSIEAKYKEYADIIKYGLLALGGLLLVISIGTFMFMAPTPKNNIEFKAPKPSELDRFKLIK